MLSLINFSYYILRRVITSCLRILVIKIIKIRVSCNLGSCLSSLLVTRIRKVYKTIAYQRLRDDINVVESVKYIQIYRFFLSIFFTIFYLACTHAYRIYVLTLIYNHTNHPNFLLHTYLTNFNIELINNINTKILIIWR